MKYLVKLFYICSKLTSSKIKRDAKKAKLRVRNHHKVSKTIDISSHNQKRLDKWIEIYMRNHSDLVCHHDSSHPKCVKDVFHTYNRSLDTASAKSKKPAPAPAPVKPVNPTLVPKSFTATQLATIYGCSPPLATASQTIGIISLGGIMNISDAIQYWTNVCGIPVANQPQISIVIVDNAVNLSSPADAENAIDVQIAGACCPSKNTKIIFYSAPNTTVGFYDAIKMAITNNSTVISISWGQPESSWGKATCLSFDALLGTAVANNITVCVAAGDNGSSDGISGGKHVDFPGSSKNVLCVGGTRLLTNGNTYAGAIETVWDDNSATSATGGGMSTFFSRPAYQNGIQSSSFRTTPDISLNADPMTGWQVTLYGKPAVYGGTSCAAPAMAGFLASTGKKIFANPVLYKNYTSTNANFHDIISGNNGANSTSTGYDLCTGMGSINGASLLKNYM